MPVIESCVINVRTKEILYTGTRTRCESYIIKIGKNNGYMGDLRVCRNNDSAKARAIKNALNSKKPALI